MAKTKSRSAKPDSLIYVIVGSDASLVSLKCEKLVEQLLKPEQRATGFLNADADKIPVTEILDELHTLPFLAERRVVLVKNADKFISANRPLLEKYFDNPSSTGIFILTVSNWPSNTRLAKKLAVSGTLINAEPPGSRQLPGYVSKYALETYGKYLDNTAAGLLTELAGDNITALYTEIDKLALYTGDEKKITLEHIESLVGHNRLFNAFSVIDAVLAGDTAQAVVRLRKMFAEDKSAEYTAVGAFAYHFRRLFKARALLEKGISTVDIGKRLRIWGNKEGFFAQVRKWPLKKIGAGIQHLAYIDYAIKTGRTNAQTAMEQLVLQMATK